LACASLLAVTPCLAAESAATQGGTKSPSEAPAKVAAKAAKPVAKKAASAKSKEKKSASGKITAAAGSLSPPPPPAAGPAAPSPRPPGPAPTRQGSCIRATRRRHGLAAAAGITADANADAADLRRRGAGPERHRQRARRQRRRSNPCRGHHLGSSGPQARRMDHFAQRPQRRRKRALRRFYCRQSELAEPRNVPPSCGGVALGRECQAGAGFGLLQRLAAAIGKGPPSPGTRVACPRQHRGCSGTGARGVAQRSNVRRS